MGITFHIIAIIVLSILVSVFAFLALGGRAKDWFKKDIIELGWFILSLSILFEATFWISKGIIKYIL